MKGFFAAVMAAGLAAGGAWAEETQPPAQEQEFEGGGFGGGTGKAPSGVTWSATKMDKNSPAMQNMQKAMDAKKEQKEGKACDGCATARDEAKKLAGAAEGKTAVVQCADCKKFCGIDADGKMHLAKCQDCVKARMGGGKKCPACTEKMEKKGAKKKSGE